MLQSYPQMHCSCCFIILFDLFLHFELFILDILVSLPFPEYFYFQFVSIPIRFCKSLLINQDSVTRKLKLNLVS
jgi:hypothetical protein